MTEDLEKKPVLDRAMFDVISGLVSYPVFNTGFCTGNIGFLYWPF